MRCGAAETPAAAGKSTVRTKYNISRDQQHLGFQWEGGEQDGVFAGLCREELCGQGLDPLEGGKKPLEDVSSLAWSKNFFSLEQ